MEAPKPIFGSRNDIGSAKLAVIKVLTLNKL